MSSAHVVYESRLEQIRFVPICRKYAPRPLDEGFEDT